jgi:hypothetical protein
MKGLSINPIGQPPSASTVSSAVATRASASGSTFVEKWVQRAKLRFARSIAAFYDRLSYEEDRAHIAKQPFTSAPIKSPVKAILINAERGEVFRLSGKSQQAKVTPEGVRISEPQGAQWQIQADPDSVTLQVTPNGLSVQSGHSARTFVSNEFVTLGQHHFLLKILGQNQGANYVHL